MSGPAPGAPRPAGQSYLERTPTEILHMICEAFGPTGTTNYLQQTYISSYHDPTRPIEIYYPTDPFNSQSYLDSRRALYNLSLVSKRIYSVAREHLLKKILVTDPDNLIILAKCLALYPTSRPHVKWLGIDGQLVSRCGFQEDDSDSDFLLEPFNSCECEGDDCGNRPLYHRHWDTYRLNLESFFMGNFELVLKLPGMKGFPDMGHLVQLVRQMQYTERNIHYLNDDKTFEQMCNIALKVVIFFCPRLKTLRLTAAGSHSHSFLFRYPMGIVPSPSEGFGSYTLKHNPDVARFLTTLDIDACSFRHFSSNPRDSNIPCCPETLEDLTLVDDGPIRLDDKYEHDRCRGIEPHQLSIWLKPAKGLRKFRLYSGLDVDGLTMKMRQGPVGRFTYASGSNINTILLDHRETLQHFEWCQMSDPWKTDEQAWVKMFGPTQRLSALPQLTELTYLKLSDMFVFTRQEYLDYRHRIHQTPPAPDPDAGIVTIADNTTAGNSTLLDPHLESTVLAVLKHNLTLELGVPAQLKKVTVVGNLPEQDPRYIEVNQ